MTTSFLHTLQHHAFLSPILVVGGFENFDFTDNFQIDNVPEENKEKLQQNTKILCLICYTNFETAKHCSFDYY